ncbi:LysR substrate-binding domain-containing protein [Rubrivivax albus]|uniref:LysR substrate-binding domain-containing protein n=1 Tax=Rubrivivax albus TaxID=2499835 RepID=UPI0018EE6083|nr:LysR substrate-binding domain-containing protein [Rubrivivax albus]
MRRLPPLNRLRTFEAAARLQSFARAADELALTASAVSHQMRDLEAHFACALFTRSHRRVTLTPQGQRLHDSLAHAFDALEAACADVQLPAQDEVLQVHCAPSLALKWLGPRLRDFVAAHPGVHVRLSTGAEVPDLGLSRALDLAIAYGDGRARAGTEVQALGSESIAPLVAPALVPPRARPEPLVQQLPLIDSTLSPMSWTQWFERQGLPEPRGPRTAFDRAALAIAAAVDGLGVALESTRLASRELARGDLVVLGARRFAPVQGPVHYVHLRRGALRAPLGAFVAWLRAEAD